MSLILPYEKMWDMPIDSPDIAEGEKRIPHWWGNLVWVVVGGFCKLCWRYKVVGRENLRAFKGKSGALVIANHTSFFDVVFMYLAARPAQWLRFVGRDSLFDNAGGLLGQILSRTGAFPVKRDSADKSVIKRAARMLKAKELVGVLPEGTRRGKGSLDPSIHAGAAFMAKMGHVPILPMTVRGCERIKVKGERVRFPRIVVVYGTPVLLSDFDFLPKKQRLEGCMWYAIRECFALFYDKPADEVDMVALFPNDEDYTQVFKDHPIAPHDTAQVIADIEAAEQARLAKAATAEKPELAAAEPADAGFPKEA